ncbi:MAG: hypothetical protein EXS35_11510 [Pedosphaera sp.]|nr:hypothetical protein [Pedosphaera sp.]
MNDRPNSALSIKLLCRESYLIVNSKLTYAQLDAVLKTRGDKELIALLDSPSIKIGDTAAGLLFNLDALESVYEAVCNGCLRTALGRKRALYVLIHSGPSFHKSLDACVRFLRDRSKLVVGEALFGLCHWNDPSSLAALDTVTCRAVAEDVERARRAIKERDIRIYSQYYSIHEMWKEHQKFAA